MKKDVAILCKVSVDQVKEIRAEDVIRLYSGKIDPLVLEIVMQDPAVFWKVGDECYFDDCYFGDVVALSDLRYNSFLGLYSSKNFTPKQVKTESVGNLFFRASDFN